MERTKLNPHRLFQEAEGGLFLVVPDLRLPAPQGCSLNPSHSVPSQRGGAHCPASSQPGLPGQPVTNTIPEMAMMLHLGRGWREVTDVAASSLLLGAMEFFSNSLSSSLLVSISSLIQGKRHMTLSPLCPKESSGPVQPFGSGHTSLPEMGTPVQHNHFRKQQKQTLKKSTKWGILSAHPGPQLLPQQPVPRQANLFKSWAAAWEPCPWPHLSWGLPEEPPDQSGA